MKRILTAGLLLVVLLATGAIAASVATASSPGAFSFTPAALTPMGAIALRGKSATSYAERTGGCPVPRPAGVVPGDQMLMQVYVEDPAGTGPFTVSVAGWTLVEKVENKSSGIWFELAEFTKRFEEGDPLEYNATWSGTAKRGCGALAAAWTGVSRTEPINAHLGAASIGASTTVRGPSITTTKPNSMVVMLGDYNAPDTRTIPPGMEEVAGPEGIIAQVLQPEAGATGNKDGKTGKAEGNIGYLIALSPEGETAAQPTVGSVTPSSGPTSGGTSVTITGTNFSGASAVKFGSTAASSFTVNSSTSITATSPAGTGTVDVTVTTPGGTSTTGAADRYSYVLAPALRGKAATSYAERTGGCPVPRPAGVVPGDQMLMQVYVEDPAGTGPFTVSVAGWTLVEKVENKSSGIWFELAEFTKRFEEGDPLEYNATWSGTAKRGCGALAAAWTGVSRTEPINAHLGAASIGASTTVRGPSITTTKPNSMVVMLGDYNAPDTRTIPPGMEEVAGPEGIIAQVLQPEAGATGNKDGKTGKAEGNIGYLIALSPEGETAGQPTVGSVTPSSGPTSGGTSVTITGTNFSGASAVKFGSTAASSFTVNSSTSITATSPAGTGTVDVTVTTPGGTSTTGSADQYSYRAEPTVLGVSPSSGPTSGGTSVTITGTNFSGASAVKFGSTAASSFTVNSSTSITATSPAGTGTVDVTVTTPGGTSAPGSADQYTYAPAPAVTSLNPNAGPTSGGTTVTITGTNLSGATAVKFGSSPASSFAVNSSTSITATAPAGTGTADVTVATPGGTSATGSPDQYTYVPSPTVTGVSPNSGPGSGGTSVTITGTNLSGASAVKVGSTAASSFTVNSSTSIAATAPAGTGTVDVTVTTPGGTSATGSADQYTYAAEPTVTSVSPSGGPTSGGTSVTITGTSLSGASAVKFGSTAASSFTVNSSTSISATAPAGTGTVDVTVATPGGTSATSSADQYTFVPAPAVTSLNPNGGPTSGGTSVTITGSNFSGASAVKFGSSAASSFTVNSSTSVTATSPAGTGTVDVTVTTPGGTSAASSADQYTYLPVPVITMIKPGKGPAAGGTAVVITGSHFSGATSVKFGSTPAASYEVRSDTSIRAVSPAGTSGTADITVTTEFGTSATSAADRFTYGAPTISSLTPNAGPVTGGTPVTVTGSGFALGSGNTTFKFGSTLASAVSCASTTSCTLVSPAHAAGAINVKATVGTMTSTKSTANQYTYS